MIVARLGAGSVMGTCIGKESSRRQRNELTKEASKRSSQYAGPHTFRNVLSAEPDEDVCFAGLGLLTDHSDFVDGVPLHGVSEVPATPFNTPAAANTFLEDTTLYLSAYVQKVTPYRANNQLNYVRRALIHYVPPEDWYACAYCNNPKGDRYGYFLCSSMSLQLLDTLMENGWWRTGEVLFKPCFPVVCCPGYALRMPIAKFVLKKKHRRVIRRWASFLRNGDPRWDGHHSTRDQTYDHAVGERDTSGHIPCSDTKSSLVQAAVASLGVNKVEEVGLKDESRERVSSEETAVEDGLDLSHSVQTKGERRAITPGRGADPNKPLCRKARQIREERKQRKREAAEKDGSSTHPQKNNPLPTHTAPPSLHDLLADHRLGPTSGFKHKLEVKFLGCNPRHPELTRTLDKAYRLYSKFQEVVHPGKTRFKFASDFEWGFMNSPVINPPNRLEGSYHMHYYLDGELVMISIPRHTAQVFRFHLLHLRPSHPIHDSGDLYGPSRAGSGSAALQPAVNHTTILRSWLLQLEP